MAKKTQTYVDITGVVVDNVTYYHVTYVVKTTISLFNRIIVRTNSKTIELPFVFKSIDVAKDFCEINPVVNEDYFWTRTYSDSVVRYYSYKLKINDKINAFIVWEEKSLQSTINNGINIKPIQSYPIVNGFVKKENVYISKSKDTIYLINHELCGVKFSNVASKLSEIFHIDTKDSYHFELIEK